jgi:hypothetical protein
MQGLLQQPTEQPAEQPVEDGGPDGFGDPALTKSIEYVGERLYSEEVDGCGIRRLTYG